MSDSRQVSSEGFLRSGFVYIFLSFFTSIFEVGFNWVTVRLPGDGYATVWALFRLFFIVTAPITAFQLVVGKEIAAYTVLGQYGKRRVFLERTLVFTVAVACAVTISGLAFSGNIASFLRIESGLPVMLLFTSVLAYSPIPALFGAIQGLKKFYKLAFMQMSWGGLRLVFGAVALFMLSGGLDLFMVFIAAATALTMALAWLPNRAIFAHGREPVGKSELMHAYGLVVPVILTLFSVTVMKNADVVFAKNLFAAGQAEAYTCAALVGSGFFIISGIFMVMFPAVSEENVRSGNPIVFLLKSCAFVAVFSAAGIAVAVMAPKLPMYIITFGKRVPGAEPLIRLIGFAVVPLALVNVMSNYLLAKHQWRFIPVLAGGMLLQIIFILVAGGSPRSMLLGIIAANTLTLTGMTAFVIHDHRKSTAGGA
ncbi:MAG: hypothetical protein J7M24_06035 [Candidatus Latescibacteria bacterium]|nr:hypothetical protein [Candidatus Latescibacterota bacterium]